MRIAVTGAYGDFGRHLAPYLLGQGHAVVGIDRVPPERPYDPSPHQSAFVMADTRDFGELVAAISGCEALIHLAAHRSPHNHPHPAVYADNTVSSYNALYAAATLGIKRVCMASSINAIGGVYSRAPRYDYFPLDEGHPTYSEDPYSLSKWVLEQQGDSFARRHEWMSIASFRFHWLLESRERAVEMTAASTEYAWRHLWAYTLMSEACRACLLSLTADFAGHEAFYIVAPRTAAGKPSLDLAREHYPNVEIRGDLSDHNGFFDCSKADRILGWRHEA